MPDQKHTASGLPADVLADFRKQCDEALARQAERERVDKVLQTWSIDYIERACNAFPGLVEACEYGGNGPSANVLLNNAAGVLEEMAIVSRDPESVRGYANALRRKAEIERAALAKAKGE